MRIIFLIFTILFAFYGVKPTFAISFTISNPQYNNDEITIDVSLSGLTSTSCLNGSCYLQAAFTAPELTRYFGFTKNHNGVWYEYIGSTESSYIQSTFFTFQPVDGTWSGQISLKNNPNDPDYKGPGTYDIKAWRYSGKSNNYSGSSNILTVNIEDSVPTPTPTPTLSPSPTSTPTTSPLSSKPKSSPTATKSPTPQPTPSPSKSLPTNKPTNTSKPKSYDSLVYRTASVAATTISASSSPSAQIKGTRVQSILPWIGAIFIFCGISSLVFIYLRIRKIL